MEISGHPSQQASFKNPFKRPSPTQTTQTSSPNRPSSFHFSADNQMLSQIPILPPQLKSLSISSNKLAFVGSLHHQAPELQKLDISHNRLISLQGISDLRGLQDLNLQFNYVGDDQISYLKSLKNLKILNISHNHLQGAQLEQILALFQNLRVFLNYQNDFVQSNWRVQLPRLTNINLDANKLRLLKFQVEMPNLQFLSVKDNNLTEIQGLGFVRNLKELYVDGNQIQEVKEDWYLLQKVTHLSLKSNKLQTYQLNLTFLEYLDLSYNKIHTFQSQKNPHLKELYISQNCFQTVPVTNSSLEILDISRNQLISLENIKLFSSLKRLSVAYNASLVIEDLILSIKDLPRLQSIDLRGLSLNPSQRIILIKSNLKQINNQPITEQERNLYESMTSFNITSVSLLKPQSLKSSTFTQNLTLSPSPAKTELNLFPSIRDSRASPYIRSPLHSQVSDLSELSNLTGVASRLSLWDSQPLQKLPDNSRPNYRSPISQSPLNSFTIDPLQDTFAQKLLDPSTLDPVRTDQESQQNQISERLVRLQKQTQDLLVPQKFSLTREVNRLQKEISIIKQDIKLVKPPKYPKLKSQRYPLAEITNSRRHHCCCSGRRRRHRTKTPVTHKDVQVQPPPVLVDHSTSPSESLWTQKVSKRSRSELRKTRESLSSQLKPLQELPSTDSVLDPLFLYACTPPKPILPSEVNLPIVQGVSCKTSEFFLLNQLLLSFQKTLLMVTKTYTYGLHQKHCCERVGDGSSLAKAMFFRGSEEESVFVLRHPRGFEGLERKPVFQEYPVGRKGLLAIVSEKTAVPVYWMEFR